jgi:arylsulfatase A
LIAAPAWAGQRSERRRQQPDIVLAVFDDLGVGDLGAYGSRLVRTPTIDGLAAGGVRLEAMYAAAATDAASRAGIFTGRYGARFGIGADETSSPGLPQDAVTVAAALRASGYRTALFGQWRLGSAPGQHPLDQGFDAFSGTMHGTDVSPLAWHTDDRVVEAESDIAASTRRIHDDAAAFLAAGDGDDRPSFVVLSYLVPHWPYRVEPGLGGRSNAGAYGDVVETVDAQLGALLQQVRGRQRSRQTLVMVTSDNGPRYEGSSNSRRGRKPEVMDGGVLVPFVAAWLDQHVGVVDDVPRSLLDITPTLCALGGAAPPDALDGSDMSPLLRGEDAPRGPVFLYYDRWLNAMRSGRWKAHFRYGDDNRTYMPMLYDVVADPRESNNLAEYRTAVVEGLRAERDALHADVDAEATARARGENA